MPKNKKSRFSKINERSVLLFLAVVLFIIVGVLIFKERPKPAPDISDTPQTVIPKE